MFSAQVYRVMIGCPGDILEELYVAKKAVEAWNLSRGEAAGRVLLPVGWSAEAAGLERADIVVGLIGSRIGDAKALEEMVASGKKVVLFFSRFHDAKVTIPSELDGVAQFRAAVQDRCTQVDYNGQADFEKVLIENIEKLI